MSVTTINYMGAINSLFKAYDIRGKASVLSPNVAYWTGYSLVVDVLKHEFDNPVIAVMRDGRTSGPALYEAFCNGAIRGGATIVSLGLGSSDMLYSYCNDRGIAGVIITASHNPKGDNGIKIVSKPPKMLGMDSGLDVVRKKVLRKIGMPTGDFISIAIDEPARKELMQSFIQKLSHFAPSVRPLKVVVDAGNGMGGQLMEHILTNAFEQVEFVPLYWEVDGKFPNHPADPSKYENLEDLQRNVLAHNADFGVAFDGDGDRAFFVDETGRIVHADFAAALMANHLLSDGPAKVVCPYSSSMAISDEVKASGGEIVLTKQGHTYIKEIMAAQNGVFGCEYSGHYYFRDFGYMDSGAVALALMLQIVSSNQELSQLVVNYRSRYFASPTTNIKISEDLELDSLYASLINRFPEGEVNTEDGLLITFSDWKFMVRKSNTEPVLRIVVETIGQNRIEEKLNLLKELVSAN